MDFSSLLADELVIGIMDELELQPDLIRVSHVSQRWRSLVYVHPAFWRTIKINDAPIDAQYASPKWDLACAQLLASTGAGIVVKFDIRRGQGECVRRDALDQENSNDKPCGQQVQTLAATLALSMLRVIALEVATPYQVAKLLEQGGVFAGSWSLLERLKVDITDDEGSNGDCLSFDWAILRRLPKLRTLRLIHVHIQTLGRMPSHAVLEEFAWLPHPNANPFMRLPRLDQFAQQFPQLRSLELFGHSREFEVGDPSIALRRLAEFEYLRLSEGELRNLGADGLERVTSIHVLGASTPTFEALLQHFRFDGRKRVLEPPGLHFDLWPIEKVRMIQPMVVSELIPGGRARIFDFVNFHAYTWMPNVSSVATFANRVTKLSIPGMDWDQFIEALCNAEALTELVVRFTDDVDAIMNLRPHSRPACCRHLRSFTLQAVQKPYTGSAAVMVSSPLLRDFVRTNIDPEAHGKMRLVCDMVELVDKDIPPTLLQPYFTSIEVLDI